MRPNSPMAPERIAEIRELAVNSCDDPDCPSSLCVMARAINERLAENAELRKDKDRLDWLDTNTSLSEGELDAVVRMWNFGGIGFNCLRDVIDAAMKDRP